MQSDAHELLARWESFYVIAGSSAATLTGLQFVVVTMITEMQRRSNEKQIAAFGTPTVVHFGAALVLSGVLTAPWPTLVGPDIAVGALGMLGVGNSARVLWQARRQKGYRLVLEDWIWHVTLPAVAYAGAVASAILLRGGPVNALFIVAAATMLLVLIGIHNAWDTVVYLSTRPDEVAAAAEKEEAGEASPVPPNANSSDR